MSTHQTLHSITPIEEVSARFQGMVGHVQYGIDDYNVIVQLADGLITGTAMNAWNRIVHSADHHVDPMALKRFIKVQQQWIDPAIVEEIGKIVGQPVFTDLSYTECTLNDSDSVCCRVCVARVYPNNLHIADVYLANPHRPSKKQWLTQTYEGLGLSGEVMRRVEAVAKHIGVEYVTLTAAAPDLVPLFRKYGFKFEKNPGGRMARAMEKPIS